MLVILCHKVEMYYIYFLNTDISVINALIIYNLSLDQNSFSIYISKDLYTQVKY